MKDERIKTLTSIAYILIANELGVNDVAITDEDIALILLQNHVTIDEMCFLDDLVQGVLEEVNKQRDDE